MEGREMRRMGPISLAAVALYLQNLYTAIEEILKRIAAAIRACEAGA